jgi:hypothetical protein
VIRASVVVKCQLALVCLAFLSRSQAHDFLDQRLLVGDAAVEACEVRTPSSDSARSSQLPCLGGVAPFETLDQAASPDGRERFVKRGLAVDVEIIVDEHNGLGAGKMDVVLQDLGIVGRGIRSVTLTCRQPSSGANNMKRLAGAVAFLFVRRGFGRTVIASMAKATVGGEVQLDYAPSGLVWRLTCPAANALESQP